MRWKLRAAERNSGKQRVVAVEASSRESALRKASDAGLIVAEIEPLGDAPAPSPANPPRVANRPVGQAVAIADETKTKLPPAATAAPHANSGSVSKPDDFKLDLLAGLSLLVFPVLEMAMQKAVPLEVSAFVGVLEGLLFGSVLLSCTRRWAHVLALSLWGTIGSLAAIMLLKWPDAIGYGRHPSTDALALTLGTFAVFYTPLCLARRSLVAYLVALALLLLGVVIAHVRPNTATDGSAPPAERSQMYR